MADNNDILKAIESIQKDMVTKSDLATVKNDLQDVKQSQAQTNNSLTHLTTALEALAAGQKNINDHMATKADIHRLEQKIDKVEKHVKSHTSKIENLEENTGIPNPRLYNSLCKWSEPKHITEEGDTCR